MVFICLRRAQEKLVCIHNKPDMRETGSAVKPSCSVLSDWAPGSWGQGSGFSHAARTR